MLKRHGIVILLGILLGGCGDESSSASESATPEREVVSLPLADRRASHDRMLKELAAIASAAGVDPRFAGVERVAELRRKLAGLASDAPAEVRFELHLEISRQELRLGNAEEASRHLGHAERQIAGVDPRERGRAEVAWLYRSAVTHFRRGEDENCVECNNGASCIVPITDAGVHREQDGSRRAIEYLTWVLEHPEAPPAMRLSARWLLNLAYMTVGEFPDGVPPDHAVPAGTFRGESFPRFGNVAGSCGIDTFSLCGSTVVDDFDRDGRLDIMASTYDLRGQMKLFLNRGREGFVDATESAGLEGLLGGLNMIQADYDNDGFVDVYILRGAWMGGIGRHPNSLLRNNGDGTFHDVTFAAGLGDEHFPTQTAAWADYDLDGDLDLFVGNETTAENAFPCQLFRNEGNGRFTDVAREAGVTNDAFTKAVAWGDFDDDGDEDLYVSNMGGANRLYVNLGDGRFEDRAARLGVTGPKDSFPVWFWDYDNDGRLDLYVATFVEDMPANVASMLGIPHPRDKPRLYRGTARGFLDVAGALGVDEMITAMGANFGDLDNDGWLDFYIGTGFPSFDALIPNRMYRNHAGSRFADVTWSGGFGHLQKGHGIAFADLDNDGDQDVFEQMGGALQGDRFHDVLYENPGFPNAWTTLELEGTRSNRSALGARIEVVVRERGGRTRSIHRIVGGGGSFGGSPLRAEIGLGRAEGIERVVVRWPGGERQTYAGLPMRKFVKLVEGKSSFELLERERFRLGAD